MNNIDRFLDKACRSVGGPAALRRRLRAELQEHLDEAVAELVSRGATPDAAAQQVLEEFGEPELMQAGLQSVYGRSLTALLVDKAMQWKERTVKRQWLWYCGAQAGLVLITLLAASFVAFASVWIVPIVVEVYADRDLVLPGYLTRTIDALARVLDTWWIWLAAIAGGIALFEWKLNSENKSLIRTAVGVAASLASVALAFFLAAAILIALVVVRPVEPQAPRAAASTATAVAPVC